MRIRSLLCVLFLIGCGRKSEQSAVATDSISADFARGRNGFMAKASTMPTGAPRAAMGGTAAASAVSEAQAPIDATQQAVGDPLQGIDVGAPAPAMVIRSGQAFIEVEKVDPAVLRIRQLAAQVGGYVGNSSISGGRDQIRQATLELKIPVQKYDEAVGSLSSIGKVETVNSSAQDVGEEYVDISARVNNSKKLEDRLLNLLATRTGKLQDVLTVERELARVREEIERYQGRMRYLSSRAAMSTLGITVHEPAPILGNDPGDNPIAAALRRAWKNFVELVAAVIASLGIVIPFVLIAVGVWYVAKHYRAKKRD